MGIVSSRQRRLLVDRGNSKGTAADIQIGYCQADPITTQGKRMQLGQIALAFLVPVIYLAVTAVIEINNKTTPYNDHLFLRDQLDVIADSKDMLDDIDLKCFGINNESESANYTDFDIGRYESIWPIQTALSKDELDDETENFKKTMLKDKSDQNENHCAIYQRLTTFLNRMLFSVSHNAHDNVVQLELFLLRMLVQVRRAYAVQYVIGSHFIDVGHLPEIKYKMFVKLQGMINEGILFCKLNSDLFHKSFDKLLSDNRDIQAIYLNIQNAILGKAHEKEEMNNPKPWQQSVQTYMDITSKTWTIMANDLSTRVNEQIDNIDRFKTLMGVGLSVAFCLFLVMLSIIYLVTKQSQQYVVEAREQSKQLRREKKTSDSLLYQMLPKSVALQIKMNSKVAAETYRSVSIYFSDIVGFTKLCSKSTPMQVVALLNKLYFLFDSTIEKFDVYKMETIGDAYMVTSGVPMRNGKRHAGELASLSLELIEGVRVFSVPHMPEERMRMRVGLHTGAVVAGIVGTRMPRYCLFGETVAIASAMESQGIPMRVQISKACKDVLMQVGGYSTEPRGTISIKGVEIETHFLVGKMNSRAGSLAEPTEITELTQSKKSA